MRIALIADLHGNRPATLALEQDLLITQPEEIWCLGDLVGKGPANVETYEWALAHCSLVLGGNWDYGLGEMRYPNDEFYWGQLGAERLEKLRSLPREATVDFAGRRIRLLHGRPVMPSLLRVSSEQEELQALFSSPEGETWDMVIYADTHRQALRTLTPGYLVNIGSVGNALGEVHGCYLLLEGERDRKSPLDIRFRQFEYDTETAALEALEAGERGLPNGDFFAREVRTGRYARRFPPQGE